MLHSLEPGHLWSRSGAMQLSSLLFPELLITKQLGDLLAVKLSF